MNVEKCEKFLIWYEKNKHKCFDFYEELLKYCRSDVDILLNACWKFRKSYMESMGPIILLILLITLPSHHYVWELSEQNFYLKNGKY